jgi:hypothetical protein
LTSDTKRYLTQPKSIHIPHFPIATLTHNGQLIVAAAVANPPIASRLPATYIADTTTALGKVTGDISGQKTAHGELGNLTPVQHTNLDTLQHWMNQARKTAKLAFAGQDVKLHQEFQVGITSPHDLGSVLGRADIIIASVQNAANLAALQLKGWTAADTTAFVAARGNFGTVEQAQQAAKGGAKVTTTTKNVDAANLYERLLTIQNAADLQWPVSNPANAGIRDQFRLNTFPPAGGNGTPPTPPTPPATPGK